MSSTTNTLGLSHLPSSNLTVPAAFLAWNWFYAYGILASRTFKQIYGIDHNGSPRQDLNKYGADAVRAGKITQAQLDQLQRLEAASANSTEGYTLFVAAVLFAIVAGVSKSTLEKTCTTYTVARLVYGAVYVFVADDTYSQLRGISWWVGNWSCLFLFYKGAMVSRI